MNQSENAIVVAVPADGAESALMFAVQEARRSGSPVHLVHVLRMPAGEAYAGVYGGALDIGRSALETAEHRVTELSDGAVPVTSELVTSGWIVHDLVTRSAQARMVVLEHRDLGRLRRLATGSTSNGVAARAQSPVVSVPQDWRPGPDRAQVVTAAVQDVHEADAILRTAYEEARVRGADLVVLHAWWLSNGYDDVVVDQVARDDWEARAERELAPVLEELRGSFPTVEATLDVRHAPPAEALLAAAERSDLLVIGRRHHRLPWGTHLGPVARSVLGHSPVPVLTAPDPGPATTTASPG